MSKHMFEYSDNLLAKQADIHKNKPLSNLLGTKSLLRRIRNIPTSEIGNFNN